MTDPVARLRRFLRTLKPPIIYRVAVTYLASGFVAIQAADLLVVFGADAWWRSPSESLHGEARLLEEAGRTVRPQHGVR